MSTLQLLQEALGTIEAEAEARERALAQREADIAAALESQTTLAVQAAVSDALAQQRQWFADLINEQLSQMGRHSATATVLRHLRSTINRDDQ
jgi:hypothetical protein